MGLAHWRGPELRPLTLVDLPGFFKTETTEQNKEGIAIVDELLKEYMRSPKSIILVVVAANGDIAGHEILDRVQECDPERERTLGIITKPDLAEHQAMKLAISGSLRMKKSGIFSSTAGTSCAISAEMDPRVAISMHAMQLKKSYFQESEWNSVGQKRFGITQLRKNLSMLRYKHIRNNLSDVKKQIEAKLDERQVKLDELGRERASMQEMQSFLFDMAEGYQKLIRDGINVSYYNDFFWHDTTPQNRLRADLRTFYRMLDYNLEAHGHKYSISNRDGSHKHIQVPAGIANTAGIHTPSPKMLIPEKKTRRQMNKILECSAIKSVGLELPGECNTELPIHLFQEQSKPWRKIAKALFSHLIGHKSSQSTFEALLVELCIHSLIRKLLS